MLDLRCYSLTDLPMSIYFYIVGTSMITTVGAVLRFGQTTKASWYCRNGHPGLTHYCCSAPPARSVRSFRSGRDDMRWFATPVYPFASHPHNHHGSTHSVKRYCCGSARCVQSRRSKGIASCSFNTASPNNMHQSGSTQPTAYPLGVLCVPSSVRFCMLMARKDVSRNEVYWRSTTC